LLSQFTDAVLLAVESPNVARAPASLGEFLSSMLPLVVVKLTGEDDEVDTEMSELRFNAIDPNISGCAR
jgi:hypothetical protein